MSELRLEALRPRLLEPVSLSVAAGGLLFLSGPSGAGKTLLLRSIVDLDPNEGEVYIGDLARSALRPPEWRRRVGLLPAESGWWQDTVGPHFPSGGAGQTALLAALGFERDVLEWSIARLSTGERQRLSLARLLAYRPEALLLDEATANLDPTNRARVETVVEDYRQRHDAAVFWVSHDPEQRLRLGGAAFVIRDRHLVAERQPA
jgi:ABC-type iron transport system FetAB ATPase subunit